MDAILCGAFIGAALFLSLSDIKLSSKYQQARNLFMWEDEEESNECCKPL